MNALGKSILSLAMGIAILSSCPQAQAGFVTYTAKSPDNLPTDFTQSLTIPAFNPALGSLLSVVISLSDSAKVTGTLKNTSASAKDFSVSEDVNFAVSFAGTPLLSNLLNASSAFPGLAAGATANFGPFSLSGNAGPKTLVTGPLVDAILSGSPVVFDFSTLTNTTIFGNGGNSTSSFQTTAQSTLTVTYNYLNPNFVPEPASLAMTSLGGLLVASAGYLRKRAGSRPVAA